MGRVLINLDGTITRAPSVRRKSLKGTAQVTKRRTLKEINSLPTAERNAAFEEYLRLQEEERKKPRWMPLSAVHLKCYRPSENLRCIAAEVCPKRQPPHDHDTGKVTAFGWDFTAGEDTVVYPGLNVPALCDGNGYPRVVGCRCPQCTTRKGCDHWDSMEHPLANYIHKFNIRNDIITERCGTYERPPFTYEQHSGLWRCKPDRSLLRQAQLMRTLVYNPKKPGTAVKQTCTNCVYSKEAADCPHHYGGMEYWWKYRKDPITLQVAMKRYKPRWHKVPPDMVLTIVVAAKREVYRDHALMLKLVEKREAQERYQQIEDLVSRLCPDRDEIERDTTRISVEQGMRAHECFIAERERLEAFSTMERRHKLRLP